jgi:hypothetical protein
MVRLPAFIYFDPFQLKDAGEVALFENGVLAALLEAVKAHFDTPPLLEGIFGALRNCTRSRRGGGISKQN